MFLQDFTKTQNLISLNISVLQLKLCVFVNLHLRNCFRSAIETSFIALTYSQLCVFAFYKCEPASVRQLKQVSLRSLTRSFDDVPSSKELTLGLPQINLGILSLNRSFVFLCFCSLHFSMRTCSRSAYYSSITSKSLKFFPSTVKRTSVRTCCQPCMPAAPGLMCRRERFLS